MRSRTVLKGIARVVLAALLFAQAALAGAVCSAPERSAARAIAAPQAMPCHQAAPDERNANLCLADCLSFDQTSDTPQLPALAPDPAPVLFVVLAEIAMPRAVTQDSRLMAAADPPPRILFQSLLI